MIYFGESVTAALVRRAKREHLQLHVVSYGGSGTVFTVEFLNQQRRCLTPIWHALLNHYAVPIDLGIPRLCLMADPPTAYASLVRRDNIRGVTRHMHGGQYGQDTIVGMEEFFENWSNASPLVFCKYEALHDHLADLGAVLGVSFEGFPKRKQRKSKPAEAVDPRLFALRQQFNDLPDFFVRPSSRPRLLVEDGN